MEIFGIGPLEFLLIIIIMLLVLGPEEMLKTARKVGTFIRQLIRSPMWGDVMDTSREIRNLPTRIIQETGLEEDISEIKKVAQTQTQMINEAAKQLTVEIEPIVVPKIDINSAVTTTDKPATQPSEPSANSDEIIDVTPAASAPVAEEPSKPIESNNDPVTTDAVPLQVDFDYSPAAVEPAEPQDEVNTTPKPLVVEFDQPQLTNVSEESEVDQPQPTVSKPSNNKPSIATEEAEQPEIIASPEPKKRTRKPRVAKAGKTLNPESSDSSPALEPTFQEPAQLESDSISSEIKPETKKKRKSTKTAAVDQPESLVAETLTPHENGRSKNDG